MCAPVFRCSLFPVRERAFFSASMILNNKSSFFNNFTEGNLNKLYSWYRMLVSYSELLLKHTQWVFWKSYIKNCVQYSKDKQPLQDTWISTGLVDSRDSISGSVSHMSCWAVRLCILERTLAVSRTDVHYLVQHGYR